ncbi:MAG: hypothetical protein KIT75_03475 [Planctomycetota bacterium]|nr:hypothetical protein [Planctomycetota bacterium]
MTSKRTICYASFADKAERYQRETLRAVFDASRAPLSPATRWFFSRCIVGENMESRLRSLHGCARSGRYVAEVGDLAHCDEVRTMHETVDTGGDCEDWAAVLFAGIKLCGAQPLLVTSGEAHDNFMHVAAAALWGQQLWLLDPKGDSIGAPFNVRSETYPVRRYWAPGVYGQAVEVHIFQGVAA